MKIFASQLALTGLLAVGMSCSSALAQSTGSGTMNSPGQDAGASMNNQSTNQSAQSQDTMQNNDNGAGMHHGGGMGGHMGRMDPDQRLAHMTKRYNLTADQQSQLKPILQDEQQQMMAMHSDSGNASGTDRMAKMQSMRQEQNSKIEAILNDDQKKKFEADQAKMQQRHHGGHMGAMNGGMSGSDGSMSSCKPQ